ncbi:hypothetical protein H5P28_08825 [Ruficoccus amylovorans]|uniref:Uncharacterized protein n=1 Tax=Ruficoccus amylovorans TaxID=1804625 RepID=A0A842HDR2_9BACT|nr:hypothetical protein [Ruficoccus amylovorans]MBC2594359.1 hypothetical protein [Ruficoccus amylovorans]
MNPMQHPIHQALREVRELRQRILEKQRFKGYSGRARALGGCVALVMGLLLAGGFLPDTPRVSLLGWGLVLLAALALNFGALVYWFLYDPEVERDWRRLKPALEAMPVLAAGAALTVALVREGQLDLLFGLWMTLYGLVNFTSRRILPRNIVWVGAYYLLAGAVCLLHPAIGFHQPLVMGGVFFVGEWFGGLVLHFDERTNSVWAFFGLPNPPQRHDG